MGKIKYVLLCFMVFSIMAYPLGKDLPPLRVILKKSKDYKENEYVPKISFEDIVQSQVGVIKEVIHIKKKTKEISNNIKNMKNDIKNLKEEQKELSQKILTLEKDIKALKENEIKGLLVEENKASKNIGFGKPLKHLSVIKNGPQNIFFCVKKKVSYIYKEPSWKAVKIGASYKGDTLECLTPCGLEGNRYYWLHIINLRTGYKGYSILNENLKEGKCK